MIGVLVIDDAPSFRALLGFVLPEDGDIELVGEAGELDDARRLARHRRPDVVLLDIHLGLQDATGLVDELREASGGARVLLLSGASDEERAEAARRSGADGHLPKGVPGPALRDAVRAAAAAG